MFEFANLTEYSPRQASIVLGLVLGLAFGALAEVTRFCLRRAVIGERQERASARGVWLTAFAVSILASAWMASKGMIDFSGHRLLEAPLSLAAILLGGALFGAGMVLTRGCVSRLTVLGGTGNFRAISVLVVFAITAHATQKGLLAPLRVWLTSYKVDAPVASLADLPGGAALWGALIGATALTIAWRSRASARNLFLAALIGLLVPLGWYGTGTFLFDDFDPIAMESLAFTSPASETLFWTIASSAIPAGFGTGLLGGTLAGAFVAALAGGRLSAKGFENPRQMGRYFSGAALMGFGGVLAGGCSVGAGLSGTSMLSVAAFVALGAMVAGAKLADRLLNAPSGDVSGAPSARPDLLPAE